MKDRCDRKVIAWRDWAERGLPGEPMRDMLVEAVATRFGHMNVGAAKLAFLSDDGGAPHAHETHALNLMDRSSAEIVLAQPADAFTHFDEVHPPPSLKWKLPCMFRRELESRLRKPARIKRQAVSGYMGTRSFS